MAGSFRFEKQLPVREPGPRSVHIYARPGIGPGVLMTALTEHLGLQAIPALLVCSIFKLALLVFLVKLVYLI
jgi:hypothetical protein